MAFPIDLSSLTFDTRGLCVVQDAGLRSRILPLFSFDPRVPSERPQGHGTTFRIDPWSRCATAFHVLEDLFEMNEAGTEIILKANLGLAALELDGDGYGVMPMRTDGWRPLADTFSFGGIELPPFGSARVRNLTELIVIRIRPSAPCEAGTPYLPVDFRRWRPKIGQRVLALGYAELDASHEIDADANRPISQYLYCSVGEIIDIELPDGARGRPWPMIRVNADWPGGMSGGPVFNEDGHVIGLVSAGFQGEGGATATIFSGWNIPEQTFGSIDPDNPGQFLCWGAFNTAGTLVRCGQDRAEVERFGHEHGLNEFGLVSIDPLNGEPMRY
jgi:serine protease Do